MYFLVCGENKCGYLKEGGIWTKAMLVYYKEMCHMLAAIHMYGSYRGCGLAYIYQWCEKQSSVCG